MKKLEMPTCARDACAPMRLRFGEMVDQMECPDFFIMGPNLKIEELIRSGKPIDEAELITFLANQKRTIEDIFEGKLDLGILEDTDRKRFLHATERLSELTGREHDDILLSLGIKSDKRCARALPHPPVLAAHI